MIQIPGFIDLHTHTRYADNNEFPFEDIDNSAINGGFSTLKRQAVNELSTFYSFIAGFLIALIIGSIILLAQDKNPIDTFSLMFRLSIGSVNSLSSSLNKATPLILAGARPTPSLFSGI